MRWIYLVALAACGSSPPLLPEHAKAFRSVQQGWDETPTLPKSTDCLDGARVERSKSKADFDRRCVTRGINAAACLSSYNTGGFRNRNYPLVLLAPDQEIEPDGEPIIHESLHRLFLCKLSMSAWDPYDSQHKDPRVWVAVGGEEAAQARARKYYVEQK